MLYVSTHTFGMKKLCQAGPGTFNYVFVFVSIVCAILSKDLVGCGHVYKSQTDRRKKSLTDMQTIWMISVFLNAGGPCLFLS